ncbi:hypothetical protein ACLKMY_32880 [Paraburkholderia mimosarum]|uniref:hypothetical protein n=1 Tax=Paraburkholderia mimosarum TaxID=312026 RepID=UPI0039C1C216
MATKKQTKMKKVRATKAKPEPAPKPALAELIAAHIQQCESRDMEAHDDAEVLKRLQAQQDAMWAAMAGIPSAR